MALDGLAFTHHDGLNVALLQDAPTAQVLGRGGLGEVLLKQLGDKQLVVKTVKLKDVRSTKRACLEAHVAQQLRHPCTPCYVACFPAELELHLVMQPFPGCSSLLQVIRTKGPLPEPDAVQITQQLVSVLRYLHQKHRLVYVDLKAENVLIREGAAQEGYMVQLIDYDMCIPTPAARSAAYPAGLPHHLCLWLADSDERPAPHFWGTLEYAAPEVIQRGHQAYSPASDWWSLGVLVFEMLYGCTPFEGPCQERVVYNITMRSPMFPDAPQVSGRGRDFIRSLLRHKVEYRLGVQEQPQNHPWLSGAAPS